MCLGMCCDIHRAIWLSVCFISRNESFLIRKEISTKKIKAHFQVESLNLKYTAAGGHVSSGGRIGEKVTENNNNNNIKRKTVRFFVSFPFFKNTLKF